MNLLITNETLHGGGDVQLTRSDWEAIRPHLTDTTVFGMAASQRSADLIAKINAKVPVSPRDGSPFRVRLTNPEIRTLQKAADRV